MFMASFWKPLVYLFFFFPLWLNTGENWFNEEGFILTHSFRNFSPYSLVLFTLGPWESRGSQQQETRRSYWPHGRQKAREGNTGRVHREMHLQKTWYQQSISSNKTPLSTSLYFTIKSSYCESTRRLTYWFSQISKDVVIFHRPKFPIWSWMS